MPQSAYNQSYTLCAVFKDCNDVLYSLGYFKDVPLVMQQTQFIKELCQSTLHNGRQYLCNSLHSTFRVVLATCIFFLPVTNAMQLPLQ